MIYPVSINHDTAHSTIKSSRRAAAAARTHLVAINRLGGGTRAVHRVVLTAVITVSLSSDNIYCNAKGHSKKAKRLLYTNNYVVGFQFVNSADEKIAYYAYCLLLTTILHNIIINIGERPMGYKLFSRLLILFRSSYKPVIVRTFEAIRF